MPNQMCSKTAKITLNLSLGVHYFLSVFDLLPFGYPILPNLTLTPFIPIKSNYTRKSSMKKKAKFRQQQVSL